MNIVELLCKEIQHSWWRIVHWKCKIQSVNQTSQVKKLLEIKHKADKFTENKKNKSRCWWIFLGFFSPTADFLFQLFIQNTSCCSWRMDTSPLWFSSLACCRYSGPANSSAAHCNAMIESVCRHKNQLSAPTPTAKLLHFSRELFCSQTEDLKLAANKRWTVCFGLAIKIDSCRAPLCFVFTPILS